MWDMDMMYETPAAKLNEAVRAVAQRTLHASDEEYDLVRKAAANLDYVHGLALELDLSLYVEVFYLDPSINMMPPEWREFFRALGSAHGRAVMKAYKIRNGLDEKAATA